MNTEIKPFRMNDVRANWAEASIATFIDQTGTDREDALCDLLCDLMHWATRESFDFDTELSRATEHFAVEIVEDV